MSVAECAACGETVPVGDGYQILGGRHCLECAAAIAISLLDGDMRTASEAEIEECLAAADRWLAARRTALYSPQAIALRSALRGQRRTTT